MKQLARDVVIINKLGLHARSAAKIAAMAGEAHHPIWLEKDGQLVDAASVIEILTLMCPQGTRVTVVIDHPDDTGILNAIVKEIESGFGEI